MKKYLNYTLAERRFREKSVILDSYPYHAFIDPSTVCNLGCPFCAINRFDSDHPKYLMKFDEFKHIMDLVGKYLFQVEIYQYGEPLINPDIFKMIEYAKKQYHTYTRISTNATILGKDNAEKLVASGLDYLTLSIDGASQETYSKYRVGGDFNKVLENVNLIIKAKKARNSKSPLLVWQFLLFKHNEHEVEKARSIASKMGVDIFSVMPAYVPPEAKDWIPSKDAIERYGLKCHPPYDREYSTVSSTCANERSQKHHLSICKWLWTHLIVTSNGAAAPCCRIRARDPVFGNILQAKDFFDIWNSEGFRAARRFFITGEKQTPETFCENCPIEDRSIVPLTLGMWDTWKLRNASRLYNVYKDLLRLLKDVQAK